MKKMLAILFSLILCVSAMPALATDAVSSATVNVAAFPELTEQEDAKTLVIYFSTDDTVKAVALVAADALGADVFEIVPEYVGGKCCGVSGVDCKSHGITSGFGLNIGTDNPVHGQTVQLSIRYPSDLNDDIIIITFRYAAVKEKCGKFTYLSVVSRNQRSSP